MPSCRKPHFWNDRIMKVGRICQHEPGARKLFVAATRPEFIQAMCRPLNISLFINTSFICPKVMSKVLFFVEQNTIKHRQIVFPKPNKQLILFLSNGHLKHYFSLYQSPRDGSNEN